MTRKAAALTDNRPAPYMEGRAAGRAAVAGGQLPRKGLRQLRKLADAPGGVAGAVARCLLDQFGAAWHLYVLLNPDWHDDDSDPERFWEDALGDGGEGRLEAPLFALGFVEGALAAHRRRTRPR